MQPSYEEWKQTSAPRFLTPSEVSETLAAWLARHPYLGLGWVLATAQRARREQDWERLHLFVTYLQQTGRPDLAQQILQSPTSPTATAPTCAAPRKGGAIRLVHSRRDP